MKRITLLSLLAFTLLIGCKSDDKVSPETKWSAACSSFFKDGDNYIYGTCCYRIVMPGISLKKNQNFSTTGVMYRGDGLGNYAQSPIDVNGNLSRDGQILTLNYVYNSKSFSEKLSTKESSLVCDCACF